MPSSAPNRSTEVAMIVDFHTELLNRGKNDAGVIVDVDAYEDGRRQLAATICRELNRDDGGRWGLLMKNDQGGRIPPDVIVWGETREAFDVLAGNPDRASWQPLGPIDNPMWFWVSYTEVLPNDPIPFPHPLPPQTEPPALPPDFDFEELLALMIHASEPYVAAMKALTAELKTINEHGLKLRF